MNKIRKKRVVQLAILFVALRHCPFEVIIWLLGAEIAALNDATAKAHFVRNVTDAIRQFMPRALTKPKRKGFVERKLRIRARPCRATRLRRAARCPFQCRLREFAERLIAERERCCRSLASKSQIQRRIDRLLLTSIANIDAIVASLPSVSAAFAFPAGIDKLSLVPLSFS